MTSKIFSNLYSHCLKHLENYPLSQPTLILQNLCFYLAIWDSICFHLLSFYCLQKVLIMILFKQHLASSIIATFSSSIIIIITITAFQTLLSRLRHIPLRYLLHHFILVIHHDLFHFHIQCSLYLHHSSLPLSALLLLIYHWYHLNLLLPNHQNHPYPLLPPFAILFAQFI